MNPDRPVLFDSHAHLVADDEVRYPRNIRPRSADAPARMPGTVGWPGGHHGPNPIKAVPDTSRLLKWMAEENVTGAAAVQKRLIYLHDNSYILDSCDQYPDLLAPVVILDAEDDASPGLLREWTAKRGLSSVRIFGYCKPDGSAAFLNSERALRTWQAAQDLGLVVDLEVIHREGGAHNIPMILELARQFPKVTIVLDHLLEPHVTDPGFGFDARHEPLAANRSIYYKFTSINLDILRESGIDTRAFLRRAVDVFGADHIMWGSDIGTSSGTYKDMVERAVAASEFLTPEEKRAVWHDTGRRIFVRSDRRQKTV